MNAEHSEKDKLVAGLAAVLNFDTCAISGLERLSGGASQETWSFDAVTSDGRRPLILRRTPGGSPRGEGSNALPLPVEAKLIERADKAGVAVPKVVAVLSDQDGIGEGYVMSRLSGQAIPQKIPRDDDLADARSKLAFQCGEALAGIHMINTKGIDDLSVSPGQAELEKYFSIYDEFGDPHPVFEIAFKWLRDHMPTAVEPTLVHGDFRHGNLMVDANGLRAVLDWELAHIGDPMEDLGWICVNSWRFGHPEKPVGGFGDYEELFSGYESAGGTVDRERVHFWEVLGTLKWGVMCLIMVAAFRGGMDRSVERATIGRRASEAEIDLLNLLLK